MTGHVTFDLRTVERGISRESLQWSSEMENLGYLNGKKSMDFPGLHRKENFKRGENQNHYDDIE